MGRPRQHDERTRTALLAAAEQLVAEKGPAGLSVRAVAARPARRRARSTCSGRKTASSSKRSPATRSSSSTPRSPGSRRRTTRPRTSSRSAYGLPPARARAPLPSTGSRSSGSSRARCRTGAARREAEGLAAAGGEGRTARGGRAPRWQDVAGSRRRAHRDARRAGERRAACGAPNAPDGKRGAGLAERPRDARARIRGG